MLSLRIQVLIEKEKENIGTRQLLLEWYYWKEGIPRWLSGKESTCNAGDVSSIPGSGRSPGRGNGKPLQYSCLGNPMDRGVWRTRVHGILKAGPHLATKPPPKRIQNKVWSLCTHAKVLQSCPTLCTSMDCVAHQASLTMGFSRQLSHTVAQSTGPITQWILNKQFFLKVN